MDIRWKGVVKIGAKELLAEINQAILAIQNGAQSYKIENQSVTKANLATLYAERQRLEQKAVEEESAACGGSIYIGTFIGR